jgi:hypothetical protein
MTDALKEFQFLSWLTAIVVIGYVVISGYAFIKDEVSWQDFSGAVGPIAGLLLGYWVRGEQK